MREIIPPERFQSEDAVALAPWLLGKVLVRSFRDGRQTRHIITETEAYNGPEDKACHASKGRTARTEVLFQLGGVWYVYLCYGIHEMLNLVAGPKDFPAAILFRGLHDVIGPGRLTKRLAIDRSLNTRPAEPPAGLHIEDEGIVVPKKWIQKTPRIGIDYAGPEWVKKHWRFVVDPRWQPPADFVAEESAQ
ncbi:MAG: DNA-3-methyladenine glycosylase [Nibricoccus sp.]